MTRKHFEAIAHELALVESGLPAANPAIRRIWHETCLGMAKVCHAANNRFDGYKFFCACGVDKDQARYLAAFV
jgi:hypothetical protein|tara:strand:- start:629 stop:847 length:219 start_codon:yes stop_codon:yes gene_type:complete